MKSFLAIYLLATGLLFENVASFDLVFQVDESASMWFRGHRGLKRKFGVDIKAFFTYMQEQSKDNKFRGGLIGYGRDDGDYGRPRLITPLTDKLSEFTAGVDQLERSGWEEPFFRVIMETATDALSRKEGQLGTNGPFCAIMFTYNNKPNSHNPIDVSEKEAIDAMKGVPAIQFSVDSDPNHFDGVVNETGGARFNILDFLKNADVEKSVMDTVLKTCTELETKYESGAAKERSSIQVVSGAKGDPHIKTWSGELYDFHGVCDLVLLQNPGFQAGLGMDINIRTHKTRQWSFISAAVLRIGDDTFEVEAQRKGDEYWINGFSGGGQEQLTNDMILSETISGYPIRFKQVNSQKKQFVVDLGQNGESIVFNIWHNMVRVDIVGATTQNFATSVGLLGSFKDSGAKLARDNKTIIENINDFGQEWQVLVSEPVLFHNIDGPQAPSKCEIPSQTQIRRNLATSSISLEEAQRSCAGIAYQEEFDLCVFDVMATSDLDVAFAY